MAELTEDEIVVANLHAFVKPKNQERYLSFTPLNDRRRMRLVEMLNFRMKDDLDPRYTVLTPNGLSDLQAALQKLASAGPDSDCHIFSFGRYDGQRMPLESALKHTYGGGTGVLLTLMPGRLAYYETEDASFRRILHRKT